MTTTTAIHILIVLTSNDQLGDTGKKTGFYLSEVTHPYEVFQEAGFKMDFVSPQGGAAPVDGKDVEDKINAKYLADETFMKSINNTLKPSDIDVSKYDAVFFAGGTGTMWDLPDNTALQSIAAKLYDGGKIVSAVCHGPAGLVNVKLASGEYLVKDKVVAAFTNEEEKAMGQQDIVPFLLQTRLEERGAKVKTAPAWKDNVQVSDRLVTGQNPASATSVATQVARLLTK